MITQKMPLPVRKSGRGREARVADNRQLGISMIEVLVTLVIVSIGLLGSAAMVINGLESNRNAYLRTQASILAYDMADRLRANSAQAANYAGFSTDGAATNVPGCYDSDGGCNAAAIETADKAQWASAIQGADGGVILLPNAEGTIAQNGGDFVITITWVESQWDEDDEEYNDQNQNFVLRVTL